MMSVLLNILAISTEYLNKNTFDRDIHMGHATINKANGIDDVKVNGNEFDTAMSGEELPTFEWDGHHLDMKNAWLKIRACQHQYHILSSVTRVMFSLLQTIQMETVAT